MMRNQISNLSISFQNQLHNPICNFKKLPQQQEVKQLEESMGICRENILEVIIVAFSFERKEVGKESICFILDVLSLKWFEHLSE